MATYHLIRPPNRYIWWEHVRERPPNLIKFFQKLQAVIQLFAAFLFFDSFPLNPSLFDRGFRGKLSNFTANLCLNNIDKMKFGKILALLLKFVYMTYAPRAPPLLTFGFKTNFRSWRCHHMARKDSKQANSRKSWMLQRNYHQIRNEDGHTITYIITVEGQDIEVTKEVYQVYSKADRRERYLLERDSDHGVTSYSDPDNNRQLSLKMYSSMADNSLEESVVRQVMCKNLYRSLQMLTQSELEFIICRYWEEMTQTALAEQLGISQQMVSYREKQILRKLKRFFSKI